MKKKIFLKELNYKKDVTENYVQWMNNYDVVKHTKQKNKKHTIKNIAKFVKEKQKSKTEFLYGIYLKNDKKREHIGNIKLGPINFTHRNGNISYLIGKKDYWGKGYATQAISEVIKMAKNKFKLKKLQASFDGINIGSKIVLEKNNFKQEGVLKSHTLFQGKRYNKYWYGLVL